VSASPLLIGHQSDTHLRTIYEQLRKRGCSPVVVDADSIGEIGYQLTPTRLCIGGVELSSDERGWLRRIAPTRWTTGETVGSVGDVTFRARVRLIAAIARQPDRQWLTGIDALQRAEDRLYQLATASRLGIATPTTVIGTNADQILKSVGNDAIVKPLATGAYIGSDDRPHAVHTTALTHEVAAQGDFAAAPFVVQQRIHTQQHLRVVTAGTTVRTASLDAQHWPLDWRTADAAHTSWKPHTCSPDIEAAALRLARELDLGYSSQDWLTQDSGPAVFIDLNPAGQWLFLPSETADPITDQIVGFLAGTT